MVDRLAILVATAGGIGRVPKSPGTAGSLPGVLLGWLIYQATHLYLEDTALVLGATLALLALTVYLAHWSIDRMETALNVHDDQTIVVDEVAGQAIAVACLVPSLGAYIAAFVLFRILDIAKPWLIGKIDRDVAGAWGTLGDDLLAGAVAGALALLAQTYLSL